jgi:hypothetical protein
MFKVLKAYVSQIEDFLADSDRARKRADDFDQKILASARNVSGSEELADLISLTTRTVMGTMDITYGTNSSDIMIFVKGMGNFSSSSTAR